MTTITTIYTIDRTLVRVVAFVKTLTHVKTISGLHVKMEKKHHEAHPYHIARHKMYIARYRQSASAS